MTCCERKIERDGCMQGRRKDVFAGRRRCTRDVKHSRLDVDAEALDAFPYSRAICACTRYTGTHKMLVSPSNEASSIGLRYAQRCNRLPTLPALTGGFSRKCQGFSVMTHVALKSAENPEHLSESRSTATLPERHGFEVIMLRRFRRMVACGRPSAVRPLVRRSRPSWRFGSALLSHGQQRTL